MATKYVYELNGAFSNTLLKNKCIINSLFSFFKYKVKSTHLEEFTI